MRTTRLLSTVAAAVLLSAGAAAQGVNSPVKPERAPAALQNAPAERVAPNMHAGQRQPQTTGQGSAQPLKPGAGGNAQLNDHGTVGAAPQKEDSGGKHGMSGDENGHMSRSGAGDRNSPERNSKTLHNGNNDERNAGGEERGSSGSAARDRSGHHGSNATTGQGAAAGAGKLSHEQRSRISGIFKRHKIRPTHLDMSVHVGVRVPPRVRYYPLPADVIRVYPAWRGYEYILVGDQILIIDPGTREVVAILDT